MIKTQQRWQLRIRKEDNGRGYLPRKEKMTTINADTVSKQSEIKF